MTVSTSACVVDTTPPSVPAGLASPAAAATSISLAWTASTDDVAVTGYTVYRDGASVGTTAGASFTASALTCGTSYDFTVDAYDAAGNHSAKSAVSTVSTSVCAGDTTAPSAPAGLHTTSVGATSVSLSWDPSTDDVAVTGYTTYVGGASAGPDTATSYSVTGLTCGTSYDLTVDAYDAAGNHSPQSAALNVSTSACPDASPPSVPLGLQTTALTTSSVTLAWNASIDNVGVTGYTTYSNGASAGTGATTGYTVTGLACGTSYAFTVDAYDAADNHSTQSATLNASTSPCGDTTPPSVPTGLSSTGSTTTSVSLSWNASTDNVGVTGYTTYVDGSPAGSGTATNSTVTGLACGTTYTVAVDAYDAAGNRSAQATATMATATCPSSGDTTAPTVPTGLTVTASTQTSISLGWTASTDNVAVSGYTTYVDGTPAGSGAATNSVAGGLSCGTLYTLAVDAYRRGRQSLGEVFDRQRVHFALFDPDTHPHRPDRTRGQHHHRARCRPQLDRLQRQRRRHRLPRLPERRAAGTTAATTFTFRAHLRHQPHRHRRRDRRRQQPLRSGHHHRLHRPAPTPPALHPDRTRGPQPPRASPSAGPPPATTSPSPATASP